MRILHIASSLYRTGGGVSAFVPRLCDELSKMGHEVRVVAPRSYSFPDAVFVAKEHGVDFRDPPDVRIPRLTFIRCSAKAKKEILESVRWADIVHIHGLWQDPMWVAARYAKKLSKPYVYHTHGALNPYALISSHLAKAIIGRCIELPNLNKANRVIATAESERLAIQKFGVKTRIEVIPIGIDTEMIYGAHKDPKLINDFGLDSKKRTILFMSRISPIKGLDMLADAWQTLSDYHNKWQLMVVGPMDEPEYARSIQEKFSNKITDGTVAFHDVVHAPIKWSLLKSVDAFVLPSRSENFSISVLEALAAGLPTICSKGAPWQVIEANNAGYWVDVSVNGLREGLRKMMSLSCHELQEMSCAAQRIVELGFKWDCVGAKTLSVYMEILEERKNAV